MSCPRCGSTNLRSITAEFSFVNHRESFVYSVYSSAVCLDCGLSTGYIPPDDLHNLGALFQSIFTAGERLVERNACVNCNLRRLAQFQDVEIAFGLGKGPPVHLTKKCSVKVCLGCGLSEFFVREDDLAKIRAGVGAGLRPPISIMAKRARGTA
jgi:transcription elongation factor Elf1